MKKLLALFLAAMMLLSLSACGGGNKKDVVGTWHIVDETTQTEYGLGIQFEKDGTLRYGLTEEMFGEDVTEEDLAALDICSLYSKTTLCGESILSAPSNPNTQEKNLTLTSIGA